MSQIPLYITLLGGLHKNKAFQAIQKTLDPHHVAAGKISAILRLRFWCHAHVYSLVFPLIIFDLLGESPGNDTLVKSVLALLIISLGSLSFAICDSFGGVYADTRGCKAAIRLGLWCMTILMIGFAILCLYSKQLGNLAIWLFALGQIIVGAPLALIDSADTMLLKKTSEKLGVLTREQEDRLEGVSTKLKYSGIAAASFVGCFLYVVIPYFFNNRAPLLAACVFALTALGQGFVLWQIRTVEEVKKNRSAGLIAALQSIRTQKELAIWVLIIAVTEGWLLFSSVYFQFDALKKLRLEASNSFFRLLTIPILYYLVSKVAAFGGSYFNIWQEKKSAAAGGTDGEIVTFRHGGVLELPHVRLVAAIEILAIMSSIFVVHFGVSVFLGPSQEGFNAYRSSALALIFFACYQFIRGFSQPMLKTTVANMTVVRSLPHPTTILSVATAFGRLFHTISTILFSLFLIWVRVSDKALPTSQVSPLEVPEATKALAATVVIVVLTIVVLNVLASVALDRNKKTLCQLHPSDLTKPRALVLKLADPQDGVSESVLSAFSPATIKRIKAYLPDEPVPQPLQQAILSEFNQQIIGHNLYDEVIFADVSLSDETVKLIKSNPKGEEIVQLNRLLLEAAYPDEIRPNDAPARPILNEISTLFRKRAFRATLIKGTFFVCLVMSNVLALKLSDFSALPFNAGALAYALSFMLVDTIAETQGRNASRQLWLAGLCTYVVVYLLVKIAVTVPYIPNPDLPEAASFDVLFKSGVLRFVFASFCSFAVAQYLDIWFFLFLKKIFRRKMLWLRSNLTTFIAQIVDTIIFVGLAFGFTKLGLVLGQLGMKWFFSLVYTPLLYLAVRWIDGGEES